MQFYYLLIILLINGCAEKRKQSATQSQIAASGNNQVDNEIPDSNHIFILDSSSHKIITNYPLTSLSTNPIYLDRTNSNYILSYGLTPELYLLVNNPSLTHYGYNIEFVPFELLDSIPDGTVSNNIYYIHADDFSFPYKGIYYDAENSLFYEVIGLEYVSNLNISNFKTNLSEPFYINYYHSAPEKEIAYIADISTNQRLFYKPDNNIYLVKTLHPIPIENSLYPYLKDEYSLRLSNATGDIYNINIYDKKKFTKESKKEYSITYLPTNTQYLLNVCTINTNKYILWDESNLNYYWISLSPTNNIEYNNKTSIPILDFRDTNSEPSLYFIMYFDKQDVSFSYGLIIDKKTKQQYFTEIYNILDDGYDCMDGFISDTPDHLPIFPTISNSTHNKTIYTNKQGWQFSRNTVSGLGSLFLESKN